MQKKKNDIIFIIIFIIVVGFSLFYLSQASYAKYRRKLEGRLDATIASWNIKVNNEEIKNKTTLTNSITPVFETNEFVKEGVIAPGSTGYFDLTINAEEVDVDFNFQVTSEVDEETPLLDLIFTEYEIDGVKTSFQDEGIITSTLTKNTGDTEIRVYFKWNDDATNQMDNQADTEYAINEDYKDTKIKVTIHFTQKNS
ncbi:MAG: hypothetical protein IJ193_08400 [Bacilli bacterium]|nr:hypothetical protein [Bacilli bacterium]